MHSLVKLLAVYLAVGHNQFGSAVPIEERSCELNDVVRLSLRDPAFAEEWTKRCAQPNIVEQTLEKRASPPKYGGSSSSSSTTSTKTKTKDKTTSSTLTSSTSQKTTRYLQLVLNPVLVKNHIVLHYQADHFENFEPSFILDDCGTEAYHLWPTLEHHLIEASRHYRPNNVFKLQQEKQLYLHQIVYFVNQYHQQGDHKQLIKEDFVYIEQVVFIHHIQQTHILHHQHQIIIFHDIEQTHYNFHKLKNDIILFYDIQQTYQLLKDNLKDNLEHQQTHHLYYQHQIIFYHLFYKLEDNIKHQIIHQIIHLIYFNQANYNIFKHQIIDQIIHLIYFNQANHNIFKHQIIDQIIHLIYLNQANYNIYNLKDLIDQIIHLIYLNQANYNIYNLKDLIDQIIHLIYFNQANYNIYNLKNLIVDKVVKRFEQKLIVYVVEYEDEVKHYEQLYVNETDYILDLFKHQEDKACEMISDLSQRAQALQHAQFQHDQSSLGPHIVEELLKQHLKQAEHNKLQIKDVIYKELNDKFEILVYKLYDANLSDTPEYYIDFAYKVKLQIYQSSAKPLLNLDYAEFAKQHFHEAHNIQYLFEEQQHNFYEAPKHLYHPLDLDLAFDFAFDLYIDQHIPQPHLHLYLSFYVHFPFYFNLNLPLYVYFPLHLNINLNKPHQELDYKFETYNIVNFIQDLQLQFYSFSDDTYEDLELQLQFHDKHQELIDHQELINHQELLEIQQQHIYQTHYNDYQQEFNHFFFLAHDSNIY
ncbi:hypothetical protein B0A55_08631 [Friedmanniomyces simplex]|uniref:Uncharacterized protein n=1 Tax=Friedmanniomyces simplex TaxID=329884 RepID=A0A4U0WR62_9PEZI|nr:hypothetical protein B0A55_08631 [Friedmanniomyces simplex]